MKEDSNWYAFLTHDERKVVLAADEAKVVWEGLNIQRTRLMHVAHSRKRRLEALEAVAAELTSGKTEGV